MNEQTSTPDTNEAGVEVIGKTVIRPNLDNYVRAKSGNGKRTHRIDDLTARSLDGKTLEEVVAGGKALGIDVGKWEHLNNGQQRMLIGNAIRKMLSATKEPLTEQALRDVFGEPAAPYDAEAAAAAESAAKEAREKAKAEKAEAKAKKDAENAAKAQAKREAAAEQAAKNGEADTDPEAGGKPKPARKAKPQA